MLDIGFYEILLLFIIFALVIKPKDIPFFIKAVAQKVKALKAVIYEIKVSTAEIVEKISDDNTNNNYSLNNNDQKTNTNSTPEPKIENKNIKHYKKSHYNQLPKTAQKQTKNKKQK